MAYEVRLKPSAERELRRLPREVAARIAEAVAALGGDPRPRGVKRLVGSATDPVSGRPELKATAVRVVPRAARWCGVLLRRADFAPVGDFHWTIYGTILALVGVAQVVWSNTRQAP